MTGIRQDRWAEENRIVVEEAKPLKEQGFYLHPELYGQPVERGVMWGRDPEGMRAIQEMPQRMAEERRRLEAQGARPGQSPKSGIVLKKEQVAVASLFRWCIYGIITGMISRWCLR